MSDVSHLAAARVRKEHDNTKVSPEDLLRTLIDDIDRGEIEADGLIIVTINRPEGGDWTTDQYRCGLNRCDEIAVLDLAKEITIRRWINGE